MAKRTVNKSQEIRDFFGENPAASAKEVVAAMAAKGIVVSEQTVSTVKFKAGLTKGRKKTGKKKAILKAVKATTGRKPGRPPGSGNKKKFAATTAKGGSDLNINLLIDAKKLIHQAGSQEQAIAALKAINALDSIN